MNPDYPKQSQESELKKTNEGKSSPNLPSNFVTLDSSTDKHEDLQAEQKQSLLEVIPLPESDLQNELNISTQKIAADYVVLKKAEQKWKRYLSLLLALVAAMTFAMSALIIKILNYNPFNLQLWRCLFICFLPTPFLAHAIFYKKQNVFKPLWPMNSTLFYLGVQAVVGANSFILLFYAMQYLNVADAIVITTSAPVFVSVLAFIFLKEKFAAFPIVAAIFTIIGVAIISRPPMLTGGTEIDQSAMIGVILSFGSTLCTASCYVVVRYLRTVHHAVVVLCLAVVGLLESFGVGMFLGVIEFPASLTEFLLVIASSLLAFFAQTCITLALKYEQPGPVSVIRTTEVLFAFVLQLAFLNVRPDLYSIIGALIVVTTVVLTALRRILSELPNDNTYRKIFWVILL